MVAVPNAGATAYHGADPAWYPAHERCEGPGNAGLLVSGYEGMEPFGRRFPQVDQPAPTGLGRESESDTIYLEEE